MSWPFDEDGAPITYVEDGRVYEGKAAWVFSSTKRIGYLGVSDSPSRSITYLTEENLGTVWARGWNTKAADALRVATALAKS